MKHKCETSDTTYVPSGSDASDADCDTGHVDLQFDDENQNTEYVHSNFEDAHWDLDDVENPDAMDHDASASLFHEPPNSFVDVETVDSNSLSQVPISGSVTQPSSNVPLEFPTWHTPAEDQPLQPFLEAPGDDQLSSWGGYDPGVGPMLLDSANQGQDDTIQGPIFEGRPPGGLHYHPVADCSPFTYTPASDQRKIFSFEEYSRPEDVIFDSANLPQVSPNRLPDGNEDGFVARNCNPAQLDQSMSSGSNDETQVQGQQDMAWAAAQPNFNQVPLQYYPSVPAPLYGQESIASAPAQPDPNRMSFLYYPPMPDPLQGQEYVASAPAQPNSNQMISQYDPNILDPLEGRAYQLPPLGQRHGYNEIQESSLRAEQQAEIHRGRKYQLIDEGDPYQLTPSPSKSQDSYTISLDTSPPSFTTRMFKAFPQSDNLKRASKPRKAKATQMYHEDSTEEDQFYDHESSTDDATDGSPSPSASKTKRDKGKAPVWNPPDKSKSTVNEDLSTVRELNDKLSEMDKTMDSLASTLHQIAAGIKADPESTTAQSFRPEQAKDQTSTLGKRHASDTTDLYSHRLVKHNSIAKKPFSSGAGGSTEAGPRDISSGVHTPVSKRAQAVNANASSKNAKRKSLDTEATLMDPPTPAAKKARVTYSKASNKGKGKGKSSATTPASADKITSKKNGKAPMTTKDTETFSDERGQVEEGKASKDKRKSLIDTAMTMNAPTPTPKKAQSQASGSKLSRKVNQKSSNDSRGRLQSPPIKPKPACKPIAIPESWDDANPADILMFELRKSGATWTTIGECLTSACDSEYSYRTLAKRYSKIFNRLGELPARLSLPEESSQNPSVSLP
ncbi:hypothetical protein N7520_004916 [Penicillium odoratum]|uniref:uncharacterized protein n=1 Tax=Penicillium odoratum TaxID=1167516 RepID=UPI002549B91B|nr:uncharacterized protein N7520_004916 [Penicillium odoratum]KAJ5765357.1 hypothetical protein N7520_004916 [Penicillium odoratum]